MARKLPGTRSASLALLATLGCSAAVDEPAGAVSASALAGNYENPLSSATDPGPFIFRDVSLGSPLSQRGARAA